MSDKPPVVLSSIEARINEIEREIKAIEQVQEWQALQLSALGFMLEVKQTYLIRLKQEKQKEEMQNVEKNEK